MSGADGSAGMGGSRSTDVENVVILGNGFDLACGLPTRYGDFIRFVTCLEERWIEGGDPRAGQLHPLLSNELKRRRPRHEWEELFGNYWYRHFKETDSNLGWVDFESEVARIVSAVEDAMIHAKDGNVADLDDDVACEKASRLGAIIGNTRFETRIRKGHTLILVRITMALIFFVGVSATLYLWASSDFRSVHSFALACALVPLMLFLGPLLDILLITSSRVISYRRYKKTNPSLSLKPYLVYGYRRRAPFTEFLQIIGLSKSRWIIRQRKAGHGEKRRVVYEGLRYVELRDYLLDDFDAFIRGFESYLRDYVGQIEPQCTPAVEKLLEDAFEGTHAPRVINFNYTSTFRRLCEQRGFGGYDYRVCHIHGTISDGTSKNRMVLGIDEHLAPEEQGRLIAFAPFRKYYQRIYKETDNSYVDWLRDLEHKDCAVYVFGHSLGITDKDALVPYLTLIGARTTIYYHDQDAFADLVANLTALLGMDEVISYTGGSHAQVRFVKQRKEPGTNRGAQPH